MDVMAARFYRGATAYAKDGRSYVVDEVEGGIVYCSASNGTETEFPEAALLNEAEWDARSDGRRDVSYARLKQSRAYTTSAGKLDRAACERLLAKIEPLSPGILDFAAFTVATRIMEEHGDRDLVSGLSIVKCRAIFDAAAPEIRATLLADILATPAGVLVDAGRLGDNLMRAMLEKGLAAHAAAFESFRDRRRR
jgi:hypothetical protein